MKRGKFGKVLTGTLALGMLLSQGIPYNVLAESPIELNPVDNVEEVLKGLSAEQRQALEQLDTNSNFAISPDIDSNSPELVNVIVEFNQAPAKVEVMKQAAKGKKISSASAKAKVDEEHKVFKQHVESLKSKKDAGTYETQKVKITREYKNAINGVAMTLPGVA
ncbi:protease inhibitor I9 family protein, partial [Bacillus manliponensis]